VKATDLVSAVACGQPMALRKMESAMGSSQTASHVAVNVQVSCIRKRGNHHDPHERIEGLGGIHGARRWYMSENDIISELEKPDSTRRWDFYTSVGGKTAWVLCHEYPWPAVLSRSGTSAFPWPSAPERPSSLAFPHFL
jgi:hypothetical protein